MNRGRFRETVFLLLAGALGGCVHQPLLSEKLPADFDRSVWVLEDIPFFPQADYQCGPAALASLLNASGVNTLPDALAPKVYIPAKSGSLQVELLAAARRVGRMPYVIDPDLSSLLAELVTGRPVLVLQNLGWQRFPVWHYAVVVGFDAVGEELIVHSGRTERLRISARKFVRTWRLGGYWGLVVLNAGEFPNDADPQRYLEAASAMERHANTALVETFFAEALRRWPDNTLAKLGLANSYLTQGRGLQAEHLYRELLNANPGYVAARNNLAQSLMQRGCTAAARTELQRARDADRKSGGRYAPILAETAHELSAVEGKRRDRTCVEASAGAAL